MNIKRFLTVSAITVALLGLIWGTYILSLEVLLRSSPQRAAHIDRSPAALQQGIAAYIILNNKLPCKPDKSGTLNIEELWRVLDPRPRDELDESAGMLWIDSAPNWRKKRRFVDLFGNDLIVRIIDDPSTEGLELFILTKGKDNLLSTEDDYKIVRELPALMAVPENLK